MTSLVLDQIDINLLHKQWLSEIVNRVEEVLYSSAYTEAEKIQAIKWLVKQARLNIEE